MALQLAYCRSKMIVDGGCSPALGLGLGLWCNVLSSKSVTNEHHNKVFDDVNRHACRFDVGFECFL
jgi:hypothetical protein